MCGFVGGWCIFPDSPSSFYVFYVNGHGVVIVCRSPWYYRPGLLQPWSMVMVVVVLVGRVCGSFKSYCDYSTDIATILAMIKFL